MTGPMRVRRRCSNESGSVLMLVLIMLTCVGLVTGALIKYAGTSLSTTAVFSNRRAQNADAEAAIRTAMQYIKANPQLAQDLGGSCPSFSYPGSTGTVTVSMCPQTDSLIHNGDFRPVLLTMATSDQGIDQSKNTTLTVNGDVWSNSYINVRGLAVTGRVSSWDDSAQGGDCASGGVTATVSKDCAAKTTYGNAVPKAGLAAGDPSLGHAAEWAPAAAPGAVQTPSSCDLVPGTYDSGSALTNACSGSDSTINLAAGVYYLNFPSNDATWTINGTLLGPTCSVATDPGVQLVFANNSQIANGGTILLPCGGRASTTAPRIAIIGLATTTGDIPAQTGCVIHAGCDLIRSASSDGDASFLVNDNIYIPESSFQTTCKNYCSFNIGQSLTAWSVTLDANPASDPAPLVGGGATQLLLGKVVFQASIGGIDRIDAYATFDNSTYAPTINTWVVH